MKSYGDHPDDETIDGRKKRMVETWHPMVEALMFYFEHPSVYV